MRLATAQEKKPAAAEAAEIGKSRVTLARIVVYESVILNEVKNLSVKNAGKKEDASLCSA